MKIVANQFDNYDEESRQIVVLTALLPPPLSLDALCAIAGVSPVKVLQVAEDLVKARFLTRYEEKGAGYYHLADPDHAPLFLDSLPEETRLKTAEQAIAGVFQYLPDGPKRWLGLAYVYQVSGLPVVHYRPLVNAGDYCCEQNLPVDAAVYYRMALEAMETDEVLNQERQGSYMDAALGICTCRNNALSPNIQKRYLERAIGFAESFDDPSRRIRLTVLLARALTKIGRYDEASKQFERAWRMAENRDLPNEVLLQLALANSEFLFWQGQITKAIERYESVIDNHEELPSDVETLKTCAMQGWIYGIAGETARGLGLIEAVRGKAVEIGARDLGRYATLMLVLVLGDVRRINEAEVYLKEVFATRDLYPDHFISWPGNGKRAFLAYCRGDYEKAFHYQHKAYENSVALGFPHHRGPDNLEFMLALEERGMKHPKWNFDSELDRLMHWPDIYMKGVALRYRALRAYKNDAPLEEIKADLKAGLELLTRAGAKIELSHARVLLARVLIRENDLAAATKLLKESWEVYSKVNPGLYPKELKSYLDSSSKNALWVDSLVRVGDALSSIRERKQLLGQIIDQAMRIAGAERGAVFLKRGGKLEIAASRNLEKLRAASADSGSQLKIIDQVFQSGKEYVKKETFCRPATGGQLRTVGWVGCFPIRLKARVMGAIFMDSRLTQLKLSENEISLLRIISNQAAVALDNLEAYEEISDQKESLEAEADFYRKSFNTRPALANMVGQSRPFKEVLQLIRHVAKSGTTVMITGETGVGKDLVARAIHQLSARASGPFIAVNVVSLSPELIASELFGHEKGAFTGAFQTRKGRFELASEGTLFLDDIDAFSLEIQAKMLRVLETKEFERVGGNRTLNTRFRLVAASNCKIEDLVNEGRFRPDFYFRLNVLPIKIPPLRERTEDIPALAHHFMEMFGLKSGKHFDGISKSHMQYLMDYHWPGNVRELRHVIERAVLLCSGRRLTIPPLDESPTRPEPDEEKILTLREMEARHILKALEKCKGRVSGQGGAADLLGVKPTTLFSKMKRLGLERNTYRLRDN